MSFYDKLKSSFAKSKFKTQISKFWYWTSNVSRLKYLLLVYFLIILISSLLLYSPYTQAVKPEDRISYLDAVFTTASAFSDTGLVVKNTFEHWNIFGQAIIAILILCGGVGIFALKFFIINYILGKRSSTIGDMMLLQTERGSTDERQTTKLIIASVKFLFITIFIFSIILSVYFYATPIKTTVGIKNELVNNGWNIEANQPLHNWKLAIRYGVFHTISAINNAGFDIISGNSLMPYYQDYFLQICFIILLIIGGIGYPVIYDIRCYIRHKIKHKAKRYRFSLFTKVSLLIYVLVFLGGFITTLLFEIYSKADFTIWNKQYVDLATGKISSYYGSSFDKTFAILFTSLSTRSAGFATVNMDDFTPSSKIVYVIMMVIGAAPASTGGGIRTTTFGIFIMSIISMLAGWPRVRMFQRAIIPETVSRSSRVIGIALVILITATVICSTSLATFNPSSASLHETKTLPELDGNKVKVITDKFSSVDVLFEVASAFGTTGLSSGITSSLNAFSKITIIVVMFIGQFGISSTLLVWQRKKNRKQKFEYVDSDLAIG
ncbi:TrkH family potassium uptake protein [Mycoplasma hafezii]|uniref:TrkH family potassium uptake protein n=1 Tax=Mycoplasma hafezii TaxID=525886 RepID=UPI003CF86E2A